jgi:hypothetical protein
MGPIRIVHSYGFDTQWTSRRQDTVLGVELVAFRDG